MLLGFFWRGVGKVGVGRGGVLGVGVGVLEQYWFISVNTFIFCMVFRYIANSMDPFKECKLNL